LTGRWFLSAPVLAVCLSLAPGVVAAASAPGMVSVPAGVAILGDALPTGLSGPAPYPVEAFWIDRFEVTNAEYASFSQKTGHPPALFHDDPDFNAPDQPVTGVNWMDAAAYCAWAGKRLPQELEWEAAARGTDGRLYPWGAEFRAENAHLSGVKPVSIRAFEADESPLGARGMAGNVSEWVSDTRTVRGGICGEGPNPHHGHGATGMHGTEASSHDDPGETCAFIKGNNWSGRPHMTVASNRMWDYADAYAEFVGFRCARSAK